MKKIWICLIIVFVFAICLFLLWNNISKQSECYRLLNELNYENAVVQFDKKIISEEDNLKYYFGKALCEIELGRNVEARETIRHLLSNSSEEDILSFAELPIEYQPFHYIKPTINYIFEWYYHYNLASQNYDENEKILNIINNKNIQNYFYLDTLPPNKSSGKELLPNHCLSCGGKKRQYMQRIGFSKKGMSSDGAAFYPMCQECGWAHLAENEMLGTYEFKRNEENFPPALNKK